LQTSNQGYGLPACASSAGAPKRAELERTLAFLLFFACFSLKTCTGRPLVRHVIKLFPKKLTQGERIYLKTDTANGRSSSTILPCFLPRRHERIVVTGELKKRRRQEVPGFSFIILFLFRRSFLCERKAFLNLQILTDASYPVFSFCLSFSEKLIRDWCIDLVLPRRLFEKK